MTVKLKRLFNNKKDLYGCCNIFSSACVAERHIHEPAIIKLFEWKEWYNRSFRLCSGYCN